MIRSRPFGNAAGSAARSSSSFYRRTTQATSKGGIEGTSQHCESVSQGRAG
jgi:hypothetical protein